MSEREEEDRAERETGQRWQDKDTQEVWFIERETGRRGRHRQSETLSDRGRQGRGETRPRGRRGRGGRSGTLREYRFLRGRRRRRRSERGRLGREADGA